MNSELIVRGAMGTKLAYIGPAIVGTVFNGSKTRRVYVVKSAVHIQNSEKKTHQLRCPGVIISQGYLKRDSIML